MLDLFREARCSLPQLDIYERPSQGFTDAAVAYKQGFRALSVGSSPAAESVEIHRHQMSDTMEHIQRVGLRDAHALVWTLLQTIDLGPGTINTIAGTSDLQGLMGRCLKVQ
jgi:hypothetical protein